MLQKQVNKCAEGIIETDMYFSLWLTEVGQSCAGEEFNSLYFYRAYLELWRDLHLMGFLMAFMKNGYPNQKTNLEEFCPWNSTTYETLAKNS